LESLKRKRHKIKGDWGEPVKNPPIFKLVFFFFSRTQEFQLLGIVKTYHNLMWISPYIVSIGVVTCLVTSSMCGEVRWFRLNFHNCYRSLNVQSYLLQLPLEVKYLERSYSDEQGFCSCFKIVACGLIYKFL